MFTEAQVEKDSQFPVSQNQEMQPLLQTDASQPETATSGNTSRFRFFHRQFTSCSLGKFLITPLMCCLTILGLAAVSMGIGFAAYDCMLETLPAFATGGETIVVSEINDRLPFISYSISECLGTGNEAHFSQVYTHEKQLLPHRRSIHNSVDVFNQIGPDCTFNVLPSSLYMLKDSYFDLEICLSADSGPEKHANLLIFNNHNAYDHFTTDNDCQQTNGADFVHNLNFGEPGDFICTNISYKMDVNGHLYTILSTPPGNIQFFYQYDYVQYYLDPEDLDKVECNIISTGNNDCSLGVFSHIPVYVIVHVNRNTIQNSVSTQLCLGRRWSTGRYVLVILLFLSSLPYIITVCLFVCWNCNRYCRR